VWSTDWTNRVSNAKVLQRVDEKRQLVNLIRERRARRIGHVMRGDTLLKVMLKRTITRKQQIGRPHCKTLDWMRNRDDGYSYQNLKEMQGAEKHGEIGG